jgi:hypothetical protein
MTFRSVLAPPVSATTTRPLASFRAPEATARENRNLIHHYLQLE